ncbi:hypothetical protein Q4603_20315 [Zobellia galactanivorans]|uniref:toxin-antitoxin system YwqK family antitoxin n=1 Tax=Zobellia galactanivorans (strain DSM 12802 / CCUG 47099 / CIP 106680 / NCIMB 13871 / Dsij) TaxID=63186 RepID=UPI0026E2CF13|nr:hypothetical protein [Zobellia galactanivorans]MDO6810977.1 hypothetical protein [Zobellia galactanivorans]
MIRTASFLLIFFVALSCKNKVHKEFYPSGNLKFESTVGENGLFNGGYIEYYDSGEVKAKGKYVDGSISDTVYIFYRNGKLKAKGLFQNNIKKVGGTITDKMVNQRVWRSTWSSMTVCTRINRYII